MGPIKIECFLTFAGPLHQAADIIPLRSSKPLRALLIAFACLLLGPALKADSPRVFEIEINSVIEPITVEIVSRGLAQAALDHASLVIVRIDTPGGLMDSMREIVSQLESSPIPVVTYVAPSGGRAASAGFFILESGDIAAMAPGTNTGAAHPVAMNGEMDPVMKQKVENDAAAAMRTLTTARGRNADVAQSTVLQSKSFTEHEALDAHLIEIVARDEHDLLTQLDGRPIKRFHGEQQVLHLAGATIIRFDPSLRQQILVLISDPNFALILLAIGGLGIYSEFSAPGMIFPGVIGSICALLALAALSVLPISWLGASLLILSAVFFALEVKFTTHGVLGLGGAAALVLGCLFLIDSPLPELRIRPATALTVALPFALITAFLVTIAARARKNKTAVGAGAMVGEIGVAVEDLNPEGRIFTHGEYWAASSAHPVKSGDKVKVISIQGLALTVDKIGDT
jgi:membrane-bound serine protease (ClpP class)